MFSSMVSPMVSAIQRYFITLDPILNSHYLLSTPWVATGDFEITIEFSATSTSLGVLVGNSASANPNIRIGANGVISINLSVGASGAGVYNDGKLHKLVLRVTGSNVLLTVDGVTEINTTMTPSSITFDVLGENTFGNYFNGILANTKLNDLAQSGNTFTFALDEPTSNTETAAEGGNSITYVGIPTTNRELFQLNVTQWDNISPPVQVLPATIVVA